MTTQVGEGTADPKPGAGAAGNQPSDTEMAGLRTQIETLTASIAEGETTLAAANSSVTELQAANKKFADDAVGLATQAQQGKDAQTELEESRKTSTDLTEKLEQANARNTDLSSQALTRRRQDLKTKYSLPEERVAELDEAQLTTLEATLPHIPSAQTTNPAPKTEGNGLGLGGGSGSTDLSSMTDSERANRIIERLKEKA